MSPDDQVKELVSHGLLHVEGASTQKAKNRYDKMKWAGAFGDVGTLTPLF